MSEAVGAFADHSWLGLRTRHIQCVRRCRQPCTGHAGSLKRCCAAFELASRSCQTPIVGVHSSNHVRSIIMNGNMLDAQASDRSCVCSLSCGHPVAVTMQLRRDANMHVVRKIHDGMRKIIWKYRKILCDGGTLMINCDGAYEGYAGRNPGKLANRAATQMAHGLPGVCWEPAPARRFVGVEVWISDVSAFNRSVKNMRARDRSMRGNPIWVSWEDSRIWIRISSAPILQRRRNIHLSTIMDRFMEHSIATPNDMDGLWICSATSMFEWLRPSDHWYVVWV